MARIDNMQAFKYSIIIPHKNTPELLQRCIDSIPERNDLEIIIVDDNSNPAIVDFDKFPGQQRSDVKVIFTKDGKGAGYCRNIGIDQATGQWLLFADADDYYSDLLPQLLDKYAEVTNIDMVFVNAVAIDDNSIKRPIALTRRINKPSFNRKLYLSVLRYSFWTPWSRMVRREILKKHGIRFEEVPVGNDAIAILKASKYSETFAIERDIVYYYYQPQGGSQTARKYTPETYYQRMRLNFRILKFHNEVGYPFTLPFFHVMNDSELNKTEEARLILKENHYNKAKDSLATIKYTFAKIVGIL